MGKRGFPNSEKINFDFCISLLVTSFSPEINDAFRFSYLKAIRLLWNSHK